MELQKNVDGLPSPTMTFVVLSIADYDEWRSRTATALRRVEPGNDAFDDAPLSA